MTQSDHDHARAQALHGPPPAPAGFRFVGLDEADFRAAERRTLRAEFAGRAMAAMLVGHHAYSGAKTIALNAVAYATALLAQLDAAAARQPAAADDDREPAAPIEWQCAGPVESDDADAANPADVCQAPGCAAPAVVHSPYCGFHVCSRPG